MITNRCHCQNESQTIAFNVVKCSDYNNSDVKFGVDCINNNNILVRDNLVGLSRRQCNDDSYNVKRYIDNSEPKVA